MNESERPSIEGLMELFERAVGAAAGGHMLGVDLTRRHLRTYAERLTLSAQPVASKELSDEQINELAGKAGLPMSWLRDGKAAAWPELRRFAHFVLAASRLDGANAGEKP